MLPSPSPPRLLTSVRRAARGKHFSRWTEKAYVGWIIRYVRFCRLRHPRECGPSEVKRFLEFLAVERRLAASSQNQALAALQFLYGQVLGIDLGRLPEYVRARTPTRVPNVLEPEEVERVLAQLSGRNRLIVELMYGSGLRLGEAVSLRVKDVDLRRHVLTIRSGKGQKDRRTMLPDAVVEAMTAQMSRVRSRQLADLRRDGGYVMLPGALDRKIPSASRDWRWTWMFPAARPGVMQRPAGTSGIMHTRQRSNGRLRLPECDPGSASGYPRTRSATRSRPIFCDRGATSGLCKNCSAIGT